MQRLLVSIGVGAVVALTVSLMAFSMITMFRPSWLNAAEPIVCPDGTTLDLGNASPVPGELVLEAHCTGEAASLDVTGKLIATVMGMLFLPTLLLGTLALWRRG